jgi:hypothetical protein
MEAPPMKRSHGSIAAVIILIFYALTFRADTVFPGNASGGGERGKTAMKTAVMIFRDINVFEGNVALIFRDTRGRDVWFSHSDAVAAGAGLISVKETPGSVLPDVRANERMKGKTFRLFYKTEILPNEFSGEDRPVEVLKKIELMCGTAGR